MSSFNIIISNLERAPVAGQSGSVSLDGKPRKMDILMTRFKFQQSGLHQDLIIIK